jgi:hypothetical protein
MAHPEFVNALGAGRVVPQVGISESAECMEPRLDTCNAFDALLLIANPFRPAPIFSGLAATGAGNRNSGRTWSSSRAPLLTPSPLRTAREGFPSSGSSTRKRPREKRGRGLIQNEAGLRDTGLLPIRAAVENPPAMCEAAPTARRRHLLCFIHRFLKRSRA